VSAYAKASAAYRAGLASARGRERRRNPYRGTADTALERVLSVMWARGYSRGNPMPRSF
jgi:hypothetical protein